jgi:glycine cleavage system H protein
MADYPESYAYSKEHEWLAVEGDEGTIGITHHAQDELGDVVFIELPEVGAKIETGKPFGSIESVKAVSELYAPVSGEVIAVHEDLVDRPEIVNEDPHGAAWMLRVRIDDASEVDALMSAADYLGFVDESA